MAEEAASRSWWQSLPGIITATGGMLTAISALVLALHQAGILGKSDTLGKKEVVSQDQPAENKQATAKPDPEAAGPKKQGSTDSVANGKPDGKGTEPPGSSAGYDPQAVVRALKDANIGSSVGEKQLVEWLGADDRTYRRIADNSLDILDGKRMNGIAPDIDVIKFHYLELLHRDGAGLLPLGERIQRPLLKDAILMASNEKNGGSLKRFERALANR